MGAPIFVLAYTENWTFWAFVVSKLPMGFWAMWTFIMFYDIWTAARAYLDKEKVDAEERRKAEESSDQ